MPVSKASHSRNALPPDVASEHRAEPLPPVPHRLVTDVVPTLKEQVLHVPQRSGKRRYIITTRRITSGEELKYRKELAGWRRRGIASR